MKIAFRYFLVIILALATLGFFVNSEFKEERSLENQSVENDLLNSGKLVIVGGAMKDTAIFNQFIRLAGGYDANIIMIPTAGADTLSDEQLERSREFMISRGVKNVAVLHTKDRELANSPAFYEPVKNASGVWFSGGRQWRIADSYLGTATQTAFEDLLKRGGVIGGSSAGATIQGTYLARGDTKANTIMMGDHENGFDFLPNSAIDQHLLKRNRQFDMVEIISQKPELLGIGIDENTALVVEGDKFEVIGAGYVAIYDRNIWDKSILANNGKFFLLSKGDVYNWKERKVSKWAGYGRAIEGITLIMDPQ
jgi:cyanophycinase